MNVSGSSGRFSRSSVTQSFMYAVTPHRSRYSSASSEAASAAGGDCLDRGGIRSRLRRQDGALVLTVRKRNKLVASHSEQGCLLHNTHDIYRPGRFQRTHQARSTPSRRVLLTHPLVTPSL